MLWLLTCRSDAVSPDHSAQVPATSSPSDGGIEVTHLPLRAGSAGNPGAGTPTTGVCSAAEQVRFWRSHQVNVTGRPFLAVTDRRSLVLSFCFSLGGGGGGAAARYEESTIPGAGPVNYRGMAAWTLPGAADTTTSGALKPGGACTKHERLTIVCDLGRDNVQRVAHPRPRPRPRHKRSPRAIAKVRPSETHFFRIWPAVTVAHAISHVAWCA